MNNLLHRQYNLPHKVFCRNVSNLLMQYTLLQKNKNWEICILSLHYWSFKDGQEVLKINGDIFYSAKWRST